MKLLINGQEKFIEIKEKIISVKFLIDYLEQKPHLIVIEYNGVILDPSNWSNQKIKDGDKFEIVTIVGGG